MSKMSNLHARLCESGQIDPDAVDDSKAPGLPACELCGLVVSEDKPGFEGGLVPYNGTDDRIAVHHKCPPATTEEEEEDYYGIDCPKCGGSGGGPEHWRCPACLGSGQRKKEKGDPRDW